MPLHLNIKQLLLLRRLTAVVTLLDGFNIASKLRVTYTPHTSPKKDCAFCEKAVTY